MDKKTEQNWQATLAEVERSIGDCLAALERYETAFARVLNEPAPILATVTEPLSTHKWDEHLTRTNEHVDEVEKLLCEQERVWNEWRQSLDQWQRSVSALPAEYLVRPPLLPTARTSL